MLRLLTMSMRRRVGGWLALGYLVCIIASPLSLTFADAAAAAHCLLDEYHMVTPVHAQGGGAAHDHAAMMHDHGAAMRQGAAMAHDHGMAAHTAGQHGSGQKQTDSNGKSPPANCCGMFCMTAANAELGVSVGLAPHARAVVRMLETVLGGIGPHRIDRPPIFLASL
jgi:hypothetical protein